MELGVVIRCTTLNYYAHMVGTILGNFPNSVVSMCTLGKHTSNFAGKAWCIGKEI